MGMFSSGMGLIGALAGFAGEKPEVNEFKKVNTGDSANSAILSNLGNFGINKQLAEQYNKLSVDELLKGMEKIMPGATKLLPQVAGQIQSWMKGELPSDLTAQIQRQSATQAMAGGFGGSEMAHNLTLRDLGLNSLQLAQRGLDAAQRWLSTTANMTPQFNYMSMFVTPAQQIQTDMWNTSNQWSRDWLANQIEAMPSPTDVAWMNALQGFGGAIDQVGGTVLGMMGGSGQPLGGGNSEFTPQQYDNMMNQQGASYLRGMGGVGTR